MTLIFGVDYQLCEELDFLYLICHFMIDSACYVKKGGYREEIRLL